MEQKKIKSPILSGKKIVKTFGQTRVLNGIDIEIYNGDFTVIMGTSGSGKSTLLYCLSGMEQASGGDIVCGGQNITGASERELTKLRADKFQFVSFFHKFPLFSRLCAMPASKYVSFSLVFALMGRLQGKVFLIQF